jgi:hypothetical protein
MLDCCGGPVRYPLTASQLNRQVGDPGCDVGWQLLALWGLFILCKATHSQIPHARITLKVGVSLLYAKAGHEGRLLDHDTTEW